MVFSFKTTRRLLGNSGSLLAVRGRALALAVFVAACFSLQAQTLTNDQVLQQKDSAFFLSAEARRVGEQLLLYQRDTGGWPKNVNMVRPLTSEQQDSVRRQKVRLDDSTIDNKATTMQMTFLARLFQQTHDNRYRESFRKAMAFLFSGQYDNGGWPQFWPKNHHYQVHITYNDNAMVNVLKLLRDVMNGSEPYGNGLVDSQMRERTATAFNKGIDCILATQIVVNGEPAIWCQQHDAVTLQPAKARAYELPSLCAMESAHLVIMLMQIPTPDERIVRAVNGAMKWYDEHMITGYRLEHFWANGKQDVRIVRDDDAGPLWARFYDLEKGEPFFCDRDGKPKRRLEDIGYERRTGYAWYNDKPKELYSMYEMWAEKNRIANRVSFIHNRQ